MKVERKNDINLRLLEIFGAVMRCQTTVDAAIELGISQPAVSTGIKQLEGQLGFALFDRVNRRLLPTEDARLLYQEIDPIFMMLRSAENRIRSLRSGNAGILRILATPPLGFGMVPRALKEFLTGRSGVKVNFDVVNLNQVIQAVELGVADVGLVLGLESHPAVNVEVISESQMVCMVPNEHPLVRETELEIPQIAKYGYIAQKLESPLGVALAHAFGEQKQAYQPEIEVRYTNSAAVLAEAGVGIGFVDGITAQLHTWRDVKVIPFRPALPITVCLVTRMNSTNNRLIQDFSSAIRSWVEQSLMAA